MKKNHRHGKFVLMFLACALMALSVVLSGSTEVQAQTRFVALGGPTERILVPPGITVTVETDRPFADIVVGNPNVADVMPLTDRSIYIQGKTSGFTNIALYDGQSALIGVIDVRVQRSLGDLREAIARAVPGASVDIMNVNERIRLSGVVRDRVSKDRVVEIAQQYSDEPIVDALRIESGQQVELQVRILEVSRRAGRSLGVGLEVGGSGSGTTGGLIGGAAPFGNVVGEVLGVAGVNIDFVINALETKGLARRLSQPTLVTTSGVEANFVVGGQVPIPVSERGEDGSVATSTSFRSYGITLSFLPVVLDDGLISLRVNPEVSDIDSSVSVNGLPGFIVRTAQTTVSLRDGQSFAIAGLLDVDNARNIRQVPWIGQVPVLGALFRSTEFQRRETDLVIVVTPRLVQPATPGQPLATPLDGTRSSNDVELFMLGLLEVDRDLLRRFADGAGVVGPYGHMIDLDFNDAPIKDK